MLQNYIVPTLAYAADGRPTTVTMITVPPVHSLKILLHPVLVNSSLGNDAIDIDRFVDRYQTSKINNARAFVKYQNIMYSLIHWRRLEKADLEPSAQLFVQTKISQYESLLQENFQEIRGRTIRPENSPLFDKPEFFDAKLVEILKNCLDKEPNSFLEFTRNISSNLSSTYPVGISLSSNPEYAQHPCSYQVWSGVREVDYKLERPLTIKSVNSNDSLNYPFDFMVQVAFTSPTISQMQKEEPEEYIDPNPWQFPGLVDDGLVNNAVHQGIAHSKEESRNEEIFTSMKQFTELQRLFRLAFDGRLGTQFPLEKLIVLLGDTQGSVLRVATPEWNPDTDDLKGSAEHRELIKALGVFGVPE